MPRFSPVHHLCNFRAGAQQQSPPQLKNGADISKLLPACYLRDKKDNPHNTLPHGLDLHTLPQLQILPGESQEPTLRPPCFMRAAAAEGNAVTGIWSFQPSTGLLAMTEVGIVGAPGPVALTLSGGVNSEGTPIQSATLYAQLTAGEMAKDKLGVTNWPSGNPLACLVCLVLVPYHWQEVLTLIMQVAISCLSGSIFMPHNSETFLFPSCM